MGHSTDDIQVIVNQKDIRGRVSKLLESLEWSDCTFSISSRIFRAHRLILATSSPVFKAMLFGAMSSNATIDISDIQPETFESVLKYVYTDKVEFFSIQHAFELLYAAKKYMLDYLKDDCKKYIIDNLSVDNVIFALAYSDFIQEKILINQAIILISRHSQVLCGSEIDSLGPSCLQALLHCNEMNISESQLIMAVFQWSKHYCKIQNIPVNKENRRQLLLNNGLWRLLRFCVLTIEEFESLLKSDNLLFPKEIAIIRDSIRISDRPYLQKQLTHMNGGINLNRNARTISQLYYDFCPRTLICSSAPLEITEKCNKHVTHVICNSSVFINSLYVPTRIVPESLLPNRNVNMFYTENYTIRILRDVDNSIVTTVNYGKMNQYQTTNIINFSQPWPMNQKEWYSIEFTWPKNCDIIFKYIVGHRQELCHYNVIFHFKDSHNNGSFIEGLKYSR